MMIFKISRVYNYCTDKKKKTYKDAYWNELLGCWCIKIDNLDKLIELSRECGHDLIISAENEGLNEIEIYDDWRE